MRAPLVPFLGIPHFLMSESFQSENLPLISDIYLLNLSLWTAEHPAALKRHCSGITRKGNLPVLFKSLFTNPMIYCIIISGKSHGFLKGYAPTA